MSRRSDLIALSRLASSGPKSFTPQVVSMYGRSSTTLIPMFHSLVPRLVFIWVFFVTQLTPKYTLPMNLSHVFRTTKQGKKYYCTPHCPPTPV